MVAETHPPIGPRFALGYQLADPDETDRMVDVVRDYRAHVAEVYFPWIDMASGRSSLATRRGCTDWTAQARLEADLRELREMAVPLDLLFNANCYGGRAVSTHLENQVGSLLEHLHERVGGVDVVTTTSPFIARCVKTHFPHVRTRASVNMRIGTPQAMAMMADLFDGFYVQRDVQRHIDSLARLRRWADKAGKQLCLLANSGCLRHCPSQTFHDNLVAHEADVAEMRNVAWNPILCRRWFADAEHRASLLQATWIRPEDLRHYEPFADVIKLATRMHARPRQVVDAYVRGRFHGNLLDLFEPAFSADFAPDIIDNDRFPDDWFARTSACDGGCETCGYCPSVLKTVQRRIDPAPGSDASVNADLETPTQPAAHRQGMPLHVLQTPRA